MDKLPLGETSGAQLFRSLHSQACSGGATYELHLLDYLVEGPGRWTGAVIDWTVRNFDAALAVLARTPETSMKPSSVELALRASERLQILAAFRAVAQLEQAGIPVHWSGPVMGGPELITATGKLGKVRIEATALVTSLSFDWASLLMATTWHRLTERARESLRGATLLFHAGDGADREHMSSHRLKSDPTFRRFIAELERVALAQGPDQTIFDGPGHVHVETGVHVPSLGATSESHEEPEQRSPLAVAVTFSGSEAEPRLLATGFPIQPIKSYCPPDEILVSFVDATWAEARTTGIHGLLSPGSTSRAVVATAFPVAEPTLAEDGQPSLALAPLIVPGPYPEGELPMDVLEALAKPLPLDLPVAARVRRRPVQVPPRLPTPKVARGPYEDGNFCDGQSWQEEPKSIHARSPADWSDDLGHFALSQPRILLGNESQRWARVSPAERFAMLRQLRERLAARRADFIEAVMRSLGSPAWEAHWEADMLPAVLDVALPQLERALADPPSVAAHREWCLHARGSLAIDPPPIHSAHWLNAHAVSALALGRAVRVRSSSLAPWVAALYATCVHEAGLPAGAFTLEHGHPRRSGWDPSLLRDDGLATTGRDCPGFEEALDIDRRGLALFWEPTGWNPAFVLEDADVETTTRGLIEGAFLSGGQRVTSTTHGVVVGEARGGHRRRLEERLVELAGRIRVGHPNDPDVFFGPLLTNAALERYFKGDAGWGEDALLPPGRPPLRADGRLGYYVTPVLRRHLRDPADRLEAKAAAPATLPLHPLAEGGSVGDVDDAIVRLTRHRHARAVSIFTADRERFDRLAARLDVPAVLWNLPTTRAGELMPRFPILPWAPGGPHHRRELLKPGSEAKGTPKPEIPWPA